MPIIIDPRSDQSAVAGPVNSGLMIQPPTEEPEPAMLETIAAAARQSTIAGAAYERLTNRDPDLPEAPPDWDPLDHIQGYENYASSLSFAASPSDLTGRIQRIQSQQQDKDSLRRAGLGGPGAEFVMNLLDPSFLAAVAVPEIALAKTSRLAKAGQAAVEGVVSASAYELGMNAVQDHRTTEESLFNVGSGALFSGILGSVLHRVPTSESKAAREILDTESQRSTGGAAAVMRESTLERESLAGGGAQLSKTASKTPLLGTDLDRVMAADSVVTKQTLQELADIPGLIGRNLEGEASPISVESMVGRHDARLADFSDEMKTGYATYKARLKADPNVSRETIMSEGDFATSIAAAARRGDKSGVPEVDAAATYLRTRVFDPLKDDAVKLGLLEPPQGVLGAESYFRRMYDREVIRANLQEWRSTLRSWFLRQDPPARAEGAKATGKAKESTPPDAAEIEAAIEDVTRKILGADVGQSNFATKITVSKAGPLQERTLDIPDSMIEKFLVNDPMKVASSYVRDLAPQVELARRFGDIDMKQQLQSISDDYAILRKKVEAEGWKPPKSLVRDLKEKIGIVPTIEKLKDAELKRLSDQETEALEALIRIRDRILGRAGRLGPDASKGTRRAVNASRNWRNIVASARLGGTALTGGMMDTARIAAQYGFMPTIKNLVKLATSPAFRDLSKAQARRVGSAVEVALSRRVNAAYEGAITEGWSQKLANGVYKWTGLNHITDFNRTLSATVFEDYVLKSARKVADGGELKKFDRGRLASLGIGDDELRRIASEVEKHGGEVDGTRVSGSADWRDKDLADIYDAAILKESKIVVQQPGAADRVWWMDSETGKLIGQLKSFSLSAPARLLAQPVQALAAGRIGYGARFIGYMLIGGYLTHALRQIVAGKTPTTDPAAAANEALTESGVMGVIPDLISPIARRIGLGESVRMSDRNVLSAYGGPAMGAAGDVYDFAMNRTQGGMSASDLHMLRRMLPYNNVWFLRRAINALEGEAAEAMDLQGADNASVIERIMRTDAVLPAGQRGGTGTGVVQ